MTKEKGMTDAALKRKIRRLENECESLREKNDELNVRLNAKRYKVIDFLVNSTYGAIIKAKNGGFRSSGNDSVKEIRKSDEFKKSRPFIPRKVDIINVNFFDWSGNIVYKGGAERYVYDLARLLQKKGYNARILQCSEVPFEKDFNGVTVVGIGKGDRNDMVKNSKIYNSLCSDCEFVIASPLTLASAIVDVPVIGINHGVDFDGDWNNYDIGALPLRHDEHLMALENVELCVCVDTNFINWTRTQDYDLALKEKYIPNYYDEKQFVVSRNSIKNDKKKVVFVYPRRIYSARGYDITIDAFRKVFAKYKDRAILHFVGQIDNEGAARRLKNFMTDFPNNVFHFEYDMDKMQKAYSDADVVLVPTRYCEGTSLSCIEGMASGAAIITTDVGGLPNLVFDGYNGRVVSPVADDLAEAVVELIDNPSLRREFAKNSKKMASSLEKKNWEKRWGRIINTMDNLASDKYE